MTPIIGEVSLSPDEAYILQLPPFLQALARRHGSGLFSFCMAAGGASEAAKLISHRMNGQKDFLTMFAIIIHASETFANQIAAERGYTKEKIQECQQDIERAMMLAESADKKIILAS